MWRVVWTIKCRAKSWMRTHQQRQPTINRQYVCATIVHVIFSTFNFIDELFFFGSTKKLKWEWKNYTQLEKYLHNFLTFPIHLMKNSSLFLCRHCELNRTLKFMNTQLIINLNRKKQKISWIIKLKFKSNQNYIFFC